MVFHGSGQQTCPEAVSGYGGTLEEGRAEGGELCCSDVGIQLMAFNKLPSHSPAVT